MAYKNKYQRQKEQSSIDGGATWTDTGETKKGRLLEVASEDCNTVDWREVFGAWFCLKATDLTRWVDSGTTECDGNDKYSIEKEQYSSDGGTTWTDTGQTRQGSLIEYNSPDCTTPSVLYRWVNVSGEYVCVGTDKYTKQKQQYSNDGIIWYDVVPVNIRQGALIEPNSVDCGSEEIQYRWVVIPDEYVCVDDDKYEKEKEQYTADSGTTWTDTGQTRQGSLIEEGSTDCGLPPNVCVITSVKRAEFTLTTPVEEYEVTTDSITITATGVVTKEAYGSYFTAYAVLSPKNSHLSVNYIGNKDPGEIEAEYSTELNVYTRLNNTITVGFEISGLSNLSEGDTLLLRCGCYDSQTDWPHYGHKCEKQTTITIGTIQT